MWIGFHGWFLITTACIRIFNRTKPASRIPYIYNNNIYIYWIYIYIHIHIYICKYSISQKDRKVAPHYFSFGFHFFSILLRLPFHLEIPGGCGSKQQTAHDHRPSSPPSRNGQADWIAFWQLVPGMAENSSTADGMCHHVDIFVEGSTSNT